MNTIRNENVIFDRLLLYTFSKYYDYHYSINIYKTNKFLVLNSKST